MRESYLLMVFWMWVAYVPAAIGVGIYWSESLFITFLILVLSMVGLAICDGIVIARKDWVKIAL